MTPIESMDLARRARIGLSYIAPGEHSKWSLDEAGRLHYRIALPSWLNAIGVWILKCRATSTVPGSPDV